MAGGQLLPHLPAGEVIHIALDNREAGFAGQVRRAFRKGSGTSREDGGMRAEVQPPIDECEALEQPPAEEAGAAGHKEVAPAQRLPEAARVGQDVIEIGFGERGHFLTG
jgi:hypothetical protein